VPGGVLLPLDAVLSVILEEALIPPGTTEVGEKEQLAALGSPEQLSATGLLNVPPTAEMLTVICTLLPVRTLTLRLSMTLLQRA
jgi:hypothetical protein